jgi:hypothetical protein
MRARLIRRAVAAVAFGQLALAAAPVAAAAADCDLAIQNATYIAAQGARSFGAENTTDAANAASGTRIIAIDTWQQAKACGCTEAMPPLEDAVRTAAQANLAFGTSNAREYGARIKKDADQALAALRQCVAR